MAGLDPAIQSRASASEKLWMAGPVTGHGECIWEIDDIVRGIEKWKAQMDLLKALAGATIICCFTPAFAKQASCPPPWADGWVKDPDVAKTIYLAVGRAQHFQDFDKYPDIVVEDRGDQWLVSQTDLHPQPLAPVPGREAVIVSAGGGQLYMRINKCNGAISEAWLNR
jgi:hypothetical protein